MSIAECHMKSYLLLCILLELKYRVLGYTMFGYGISFKEWALNQIRYGLVTSTVLCHYYTNVFCKEDDRVD